MSISTTSGNRFHSLASGPVFGAHRIVPLLQNLDNDIIRDKNAIPQKIDVLEKKDLENFASKAQYDLDDFFVYDFKYLFDLNIPLKSGEDPVGHGTTYFYKRKNDKLNTKQTFQDCVENTWRLKCALAFYNEITKDSDLSAIENIKTPYIKNLIDHFKKYSPTETNNGDIA